MDFVTNQSTAPRRRRSGVFSKIIIVVLLITGIVVYWKFFMNYSSGIRYGLLQKFSRKGNVFKTYEGELILSSVTSNNNVSLASEKFYFSVTNAHTADKLMHAQGNYVRLYYNEKNGTLSWRGDTRYIVDSVELVTSPEEQRR
jgi:hypothetical protein